MVEIISTLDADIFYIHFDVNDHYLKIDSFIKTAQATSEIFYNLNDLCFSKAFDFELIILPPAGGTFLGKIGVIKKGLTYSAVAFSAGIFGSDIASGIIEGLTQKTPQEWSRDLTKQTLNFFIGNEQNIELNEQEKNELTSLSSKMLCEMAQKALTLENALLPKDMLINEKYSPLIEARHEFYKACDENIQIKGIGFSKEDDFPIKRHEFPDRALNPKLPTVDENANSWKSEICEIIVTSPNWVKDDQKVRQWKGKHHRHDCFFTIIDDNFWDSHKSGKLNLNHRGFDKMKVQWVGQPKDERIQKPAVVKVIKFNDQDLSQPLSQDEITRIIESYSLPDFFN